jgi:hypothetical protein
MIGSAFAPQSATRAEGIAPEQYLGGWVMRAFKQVALALLLAWSSTSPAFAGMAMIETAAQLNEDSTEGVKAAVQTAVATAVEGALAMGLSQIALNAVRVLPGVVIVQILATDSAQDAHESDSSSSGAEKDQEVQGRMKL